MKDIKKLSHPTLEALLAEIFEMTLDGWAIADDDPGEVAMFGGAYSVGMVRSDATINALKTRVDSVQSRPKLTPAERMAYARAQRGKGKLDLSCVVGDD
jgi:hypothetical protein